MSTRQEDKVAAQDITKLNEAAKQRREDPVHVRLENEQAAEQRAKEDAKRHQEDLARQRTKRRPEDIGRLRDEVNPLLPE